MSSELSILALYGLIIMIVILLQVLAAMGQVGLSMLAHERSDMPVLTGVAGRLDRAQKNSICAFALFAPAVLLLNAMNGFTASSLFAAQIFLIARILYVVVYATGTPWLRTGAWAVGFFATAYLYFLVL